MPGEVTNVAGSILWVVTYVGKEISQGCIKKVHMKVSYNITSVSQDTPYTPYT